MKRIFTYSILAAILAISLLLWLYSKTSFAMVRYTPWLFAAQGCGIVAVTLLSLNFIFTTRFRFLESVCGGLQELYHTHKLVGISGVSFAILHFTFFMVHAASYPTLFPFYLIPGDNWSLNFSRAALLLFVILILMTFSKRLPYHIWKYSHQFMGLAFFLAALHVVTIQSDVANNMLLRYWLIGLMSAGLLSFIYTKLIYPIYGPRFDYVISEIEHLKGNVHVIRMMPLGKRMRYRPAQFVFVSFLSKAVGKESHPFTITSSEEDEALTISPKETGDFTSHLRNLEVGEKVRIWGPYGSFGDPFLMSRKDQVWISGGIGVTPFLGMLAYQKKHPMRSKKWMFYCSRSDEDATYDARLAEETKELGIEYKHHKSNNEGYLNLEYIKKSVPELKNKLFFISGPEGMRSILRDRLLDEGVDHKNILFDVFRLR